MAGRVPLPQPLTSRPRMLEGGGTNSGNLNIPGEGFVPREVIEARRAEMTTDSVGEQLTMRLMRADDAELNDLSGVLSQVVQEANAGDFTAADAYGVALGNLMAQAPDKWLKVVDSLRTMDPETGKMVPLSNEGYRFAFVPESRAAAQTAAPIDNPAGIMVPELDVDPAAASQIGMGNIGAGETLDLQRLLLGQGPARQGGELAAQTAPRAPAEAATRRDFEFPRGSDVLNTQTMADGTPRLNGEGKPLTPADIAKPYYYDERVSTGRDSALYSDLQRMAHIRELARLTNVPFEPRYVPYGGERFQVANETVRPLEDYLSERTTYSPQTNALTYNDGVDQQTVSDYLNMQLGQAPADPALAPLLQGLTQAPDGSPRVLENPDVMERMVRDVVAANPDEQRQALLAGLTNNGPYEGPTQVQMSQRDMDMMSVPRSQAMRMGEHIDEVLSGARDHLDLDLLTGGPDRTPYWRREDFLLPDPVTGELFYGPMPAEHLANLIAQQLGRNDPYYIKNLVPYVAQAMMMMQGTPAPTAKQKPYGPARTTNTPAYEATLVDYYKKRGVQPMPKIQLHPSLERRINTVAPVEDVPQVMPEASPVTPAMDTSSMMRPGMRGRGRFNPLTSLIG